MTASHAPCGISQSGSASAPPKVIGSTTNIAVIVATNQVGHGVADSASTDTRTSSVSARAARACSGVGRDASPLVSMPETLASEFPTWQESSCQDGKSRARGSRTGHRAVSVVGFVIAHGRIVQISSLLDRPRVEQLGKSLSPL
ncbi:hypothetical protein LUW74_37300 [Actinomadura madurae]|uniref:hypothetical protein n=1 Tax=Actinomadura madurae TaxID=1993 RepID=UPI0020270889|nr:hypothetical protein [Actinomadura madurae]URN08480.1 hypothetical protein LUW74_37300 [Actinomadura madurae]